MEQTKKVKEELLDFTEIFVCKKKFIKIYLPIFTDLFAFLCLQSSWNDRESVS